MLLTCRFLNDLADVNHWRPVNQSQQYAGDAPATLYFQLMDAAAHTQLEGYTPPGRRYCAAAGATLSVTLLNLDQSKQAVKVATAAFPTVDRSIWSIQMQTTDTIQGTVNLLLTLTEGAVISHGRAEAALLISNSSQTGC